MATPYAMVPQPLPLEALLNRYLPPPPSTMTPGSAMAAPSGPAARLPGWGDLRAIGAGLLAPLGAPEPTYQVQDVPSLSGQQTLPTPVASADLNAAMAESPSGAFIGQSVGLGPAFRLAGAGARAIAASPPAQWLGRQLARPAVQAGVTAPLAVGGASLATAADTQTPTPATRETGAQQVLDRHRAALTNLGENRASLQTRLGRYDPENIVNLNEAQIKEAQAAVGATPDGRIGPQTRAAIAAYQRQLQAQIDALGPRETTLRGDITAAEAALAEARRLDLQERGSQRLKETEPGWLETLAPWLGLPAGFASGYYLRRGLGNYSRRQVAGQVDDAERLAAQFGQGDVPERVGRLNQWWTRGSPGTAPPFSFTPGASPFPWASATHEIKPGLMGGQSQRTVVPADQLYAPSLGARFGPTATTMGLGGLEAGIGHAGSSYFEPLLAEAEAAATREPTEANIQRLQRLRSYATAFGFSERLGLGTMSGGLYSAAKNPMRGLPRPDVMAGEAERGAIDLLLQPRRLPTPPGPTGAPAAPTPAVTFGTPPFSLGPTQILPAAPPTPPTPPPVARPSGLPAGAYQNAAGRWVVMTPGGPRYVSGR